MMARRYSIIASFLLGASGACTPSTSQRLGLLAPAVAATVDLDRYLGTWYEIASFPKWFQRGCTGSIATYRAADDGRILVQNSCHLDQLEGPLRVANGIVRQPDPAKPGQLRVSFWRPFWGDYWILELASDYSHAVVGAPSRDALWILSRTPQLPRATYAGILTRLRGQGFETERLVATLQPTGLAELP